MCLGAVFKYHEVVSYGAERVAAEQDDKVEGQLCREEKVGVPEVGLEGLLLSHRANKEN